MPKDFPTGMQQFLKRASSSYILVRKSFEQGHLADFELEVIERYDSYKNLRTWLVFKIVLDNAKLELIKIRRKPVELLDKGT